MLSFSRTLYYRLSQEEASPRPSSLNLCFMRCSSGSPSGSITRLRAGVAQLVEQLICNQPVGGSNPFASPTISIALLTTPDKKFERLTAMRSASRMWSVGVVAKRSNAAGCKPAGLAPSKVRILPAPPISGERITGGSSSVGRASAFQAEGRGSESRLPLQFHNGVESSNYGPTWLSGRALPW